VISRLALLGAIAAGAIAGCYRVHERAEPCRALAPDPQPCTRWEQAGAVTRVSDPAPVTVSLFLSSAVATECGALAAWTTLTGAGIPTTRSFETRTIDWSGAPTAATRAHPDVTTTMTDAAAVDLVTNGDEVAAFFSTSPGGCRFVPLDARGVERGPIASVDVAWCLAPLAVEDGYSTLTWNEGTTPGTLVGLDASGHETERTILDMPSARALWSRTPYDDGSFLLYSFREDPVTTVYTGWLQRFDPHGRAIAPEVEVGVNGVPVHAAPTEPGALIGWSTATSGGLPVQVRPIDRDGRPIGETRDVDATGALYALLLTPTPQGDVLATWVESHFHDEPEWRLNVQAFGPDALPRGEPTRVLTDVYPQALRILVDASGERALGLFDDDGVFALPLACAR
jgi:hypothetical protein